MGWKMKLLDGAFIIAVGILLYMFRVIILFYFIGWVSPIDDKPLHLPIPFMIG